MNERDFEQLRDIARRRELTAAEHARLHQWLGLHPQAQAAWDEERRLDQLLRRLPDVPVSANFTARVLAAVQREGNAGRVPWRDLAWWWRLRLWPRLAAAAVVLAAVVSLSVWQVRERQRAQVAASVRALSGVATVPTVEMLADFDAIVRLSQLPANSDAGVLTALQSR
jgi:anti-sigma factor RsiW